VIDHGDQLREAFEKHENLAPDPAAVYARVQELARTYKWRRRGVQAAGGAVLSAGLIAGVVTIPGLLPGRSGGAVVMVAPAAAPSAAPTGAELQKDLDAYFAAGYGYGDAVQLALIWNSTAKVGEIKAEAGRLLLAGETLPIQPGPRASDGSPDPVDPKVDAQLAAFFDAGYTYEEAVKLAAIWKIADPQQAKVEGGKRLLAGQTLPVAPNPEEAAVQAFFKAGYSYTEAKKLAKIWKSKDAYAAKIEGGKRLLAGKKLPIKPSAASLRARADEVKINKFFAAGYDYDDAMQLAKIWKSKDAYAAKVEGGKRLLAGQTLPIQP
jgi:hypothetical protein